MHFEFTTPAARQVCLAGSFNDWKPEISPMNRLGDGKWAKDLMLSPGCYEYRFVVDGVWMPDPTAEHMVVNQFGERNSLLTIASGCSDSQAG